MGAKGYFIQYRFITPEDTKHSSYNYQKLFRALYGYTQAVDKSTGKRYRYHRKGVLSDVPHIRPRKNCVIIPPEYFQRLIEFFKTGRNPTHVWRGKGDWKAVYYMNEKNLTEQDIIAAFDGVLHRELYLSRSEGRLSLIQALQQIAENGVSEQNHVFASSIVSAAKDLVNLEWFKQTYQKSEKLTRLYSNYRMVRAAIGQ